MDWRCRRRNGKRGVEAIAAMRRRLPLLALLLTLLALIAGPVAAGAVSPQVAGLQVALRAYGCYAGAIDGILGPATSAGVRRFQRRAGLAVDGKAGPATRRAFGPLGRPLFARRTLRRGTFGWDVSVLQFLLARRGALVPISGYFDARTERAVRGFQQARRLSTDGIAGPRTFAAFVDRAPKRSRAVVAGVTRTPSARVRALIDHWAAIYGVDRPLVRALAWMESGFQTNLTSSAGAWGVMQIIPPTWSYVEDVLLGRKVPRTTSGNIRVGIVFMRQLMREFGGDARSALAAWYQGPRSVRKRGPLRETKLFVDNVLALRERFV
jgi:peptidoglycan hydrolase-like protein with peptidoglycan-binding domain